MAAFAEILMDRLRLGPTAAAFPGFRAAAPVGVVRAVCPPARSRRSERAVAAVRGRARVGVEDRPVQRLGPPRGEPPDGLGPVRPGVAGWPRTPAAGSVP